MVLSQSFFVGEEKIVQNGQTVTKLYIDTTMEQFVRSKKA